MSEHLDNEEYREFWAGSDSRWLRLREHRAAQLAGKAVKVGGLVAALAAGGLLARYGIEVAQGPDYGPAREEPSDAVESPATIIDQCLAEALAEPAEDAAVLMRRAEACRLGQQADPREPAPSQPQN